MEGLGLSPYQIAPQMAGGPQLPMAAPQSTFMAGASANFPMSNPLALGGLGGYGGGMGGMGGMGGYGMMGGGGGGGGGGPYVYEVDDDDDDDEQGGLGFFSPTMMAMLPMAGLAFLGGLTFSSLSSMVLDVLNSLSINSGNTNNRGSNDGTGTSRQKRELTDEMLYRLHQIDTFRKVLAAMPESKKFNEAHAAKFLSCSGLTDDNNLCLERAACEFTNNNSTASSLQKDALSMTVTYILRNDYVPQGIKERIRRAANFGREGQLECKSYFPCKPSKW